MQKTGQMHGRDHGHFGADPSRTTWEDVGTAGGSGSTVTVGHIIADEGSPLTQRPTLNFVGSGVAAADSGGTTVVTISGSTATVGHGIYDEGSLLTQRAALNFVGAGVSAADSGGTTVVTISGGGGGGGGGSTVPFAYYHFVSNTWTPADDNGPIEWRTADFSYDPDGWLVDSGTYGTSVIGVDNAFFSPPFGDYKVTVSTVWNAFDFPSQVGQTDAIGVITVPYTGGGQSVLLGGVDWPSVSDVQISLSTIITVDNDVDFGWLFYASFLFYGGTLANVTPALKAGSSILVEQLRAT